MSFTQIFRKASFLSFGLRARNGSGPVLKKRLYPAIRTKLNFEDQEIVLDNLQTNATPRRTFIVQGQAIENPTISLQQISSITTSRESINQNYNVSRSHKLNKDWQNYANVQPQSFIDNPVSAAKIFENLGTISSGEGRFEEALGYFEKCLKIKQTIFGFNHQETAVTIKKMGLVYQSQGFSDKAIERLEKVLNIELTAKEKPKGIVATYNNLADCYRGQGNLDKALELCQKAFEVLAVEQAGAEKTITMYVLGKIYFDQQKNEEARKTFEQALDTLSIHRQEDHLMIAKIFNGISLVQKELGNFDEAQELLQKSLKMQQKLLNKTHPDIGATYNLLGALYYIKGEYQNAKLRLNKAWLIQKAVFGINHKFVATTLNDLGLVHHMSGDYNKALKYFKNSLEIRLEALENHHDTATSYYNLGTTYSSQGKYQKALEAFQEYMRIEAQLLPADHPNLAEPYHYVGKTYQDMKEFSKALEYYRKEADIKAKVYGENSVEVADVYKQIGSMYFDQQDYQKTITFCRKSFDIYSKTCGFDSFAGQQINFFLESAYKALGHSEATIRGFLETNSENPNHF